MNEQARQTLYDLIARYGVGLASDAKRCESLLRDYCGAHRREINLLVSAVEERVGLDLLAANRQMPLELLLKKLENRLEENLAVTPDAARWAIESWALALQVATVAQIAERANESIKTRAPAVEPGLTARDDKPNQPANPPANQKKAAPPPKPPATAPPAPPPIFKPASPPNPSFFPPPQSPPNNNAIQPRARNSSAAATAASNALPTPAQSNRTAHTPAQNQHRKRGWFSIRGCFTGCLLILIMLAVLIIGVPYAINVMRETQQTETPARVPPR